MNSAKACLRTLHTLKRYKINICKVGRPEERTRHEPPSPQTQLACLPPAKTTFSVPPVSQHRSSVARWGPVERKGLWHLAWFEHQHFLSMKQHKRVTTKSNIAGDALGPCCLARAKNHTSAASGLVADAFEHSHSETHSSSRGGRGNGQALVQCAHTNCPTRLSPTGMRSAPLRRLNPRKSIKSLAPSASCEALNDTPQEAPLAHVALSVQHESHAVSQFHLCTESCRKPRSMNNLQRATTVARGRHRPWRQSV